MIAPNGNKSNLTPEQYKLVRTPEFKAWFGDWENSPETASKVVDENGEPLVVFHSSNKEFNEFEMGMISANFEYSFGFHFSNDIDDSKEYGQITKSFFLKIINPFVFNVNDNTNGSVFIDNNRYHAINEIVKSRKTQKEIDGVIAYSLTNGYVTMYDTQIKLADGTNTKFDTSNPDIRYEQGGLIAPNGNKSNLTAEQYKLVRTPEFKAWFGDWENSPESASKVVDENREPLVMYSGSPNQFTIFKNDFIDFDKDDKEMKSRFWFTIDKNSAEIYSRKKTGNIENVYECFLNIRKPKFDFNLYVDDNNDGAIEFNNKKISVAIAIISNQIKLADGTNTTFNMEEDIRYKKGGRTIAQTPAPKSDRVKGSKVNKVGSATAKGASNIELSDKTMDTLKGKLEEFKKSNPRNTTVTLNDLKAVYRRGSGAYSTSHRPNITRAGWSYARVNKFLEKAAGKKVKAAYVQDDDLFKYEKGGEIFYHGSENPLKLNENTKPIFFTKDQDYAKGYGSKIYKYQLLASNYFDTRNDNNAVYIYNEKFLPFALEKSRGQERYKEIKLGEPITFITADLLWLFLRVSKRKNNDYFYDGIIVYEGDFSDDFKYANYSYVPLDVSQIEIYNEDNTKYGQGGLIAPNGKKSNLTAEQYKLVRTPEFKAWFGDWENSPETSSKVVDKNGEPLVVYHGTDSKFNFFDKNKLRNRTINSLAGFHFSDNYNTALSYTADDDEELNKEYTIEVFLRFINPYFHDVKGVLWADLDYENNTDVIAKRVYESKNNDGVIFTNTLDAYIFQLKEEDYKGNSFVAFEPEQIKLADGTNTTFDGDNPDMRFKEGGKTFNDKELLARWKKGESIGFTAIAHLKAKGLIPRADGDKKVSEKYMEQGGEIDETITCMNCGWHWKESETEEFDMYVCHKCGFDNAPFYEKKQIALPDTYSTYGVLKDVLSEQGYDISKEDIMSKLKKPKTLIEISEIHGVDMDVLRSQLEKGVKAEMEHTTDENIARTIALHHLEEMPNYYDMLEKMEMGVNEMADGGVVVGKRHSESDEFGTGERFTVKSTGQVVEVEGGEGVLCKESMESSRLFHFDGKKMTGREIASILNHKYGGVEFAKGGKVKDCGCDSIKFKHGGELPSATLEGLEGGEAVVTVKTMESKDEYNFNGGKSTPRKILSVINAASGGKKFENGGTIDISKHKIENLNKLAQMVYFTENMLYYK
jgi:hypothetical protein